MLTFEDFFAKKKIDLQALKADNQELYTEFQRHYQAMGEKSFDHTKKFWFNNLRKSYKLNEPDSVVQKTETAGQSATTPISATLGFKSKFKSDTPPTSSSENIIDDTSEEPSTPAQENKPAGFKPRFKAGASKIETTSSESAQESPTIEETTSKPSGFKPRFKAGVTKNENTSADTTKQTTTDHDEASNKPAGFKPRFKAGVTKITKQEEDPVAEADTTEKLQESVPTENKPKGFTPRFKSGVTKSATQESITSATDKAPTPTDQGNQPTGFKPRFKADVTQASKPDQNPPEQ